MLTRPTPPVSDGIVPHKFLAHIQMRPNEGGEMFTVEHEFEAPSWHAAWDKVMAMGRSFDATVTWHRILPINVSTGEIDTSDGVTLPVAPGSVTRPPLSVLALSPPKKEEEAPPPSPSWFKTLSLKFTMPEPWPETLTVNAAGG